MLLRPSFFLTLILPGILIGSVLIVIPLLQCTTTGGIIDEGVLKNYDDASKGSDLQILAHSGQSEGMRLQDLPVWLSTYIRSGDLGLEALPDYGENYAFVVEYRASTLQEIRTWISTCNPMKDLALLVGKRSRVRLADLTREAVPREGTSLIDVAAGFVQATENAFYGGAREINRWWIQTKNTEYRGYVFLVMDQEMLDRQLHRLMVDNNLTLTQEEREIWMRTRF
jgi:hypothetical protein